MGDRFPTGFTIQAIGVEEAKEICDLPGADLATYLRKHPQTAKALLYESQDKRFTPSSFITEKGIGFRVGWVTREAKYECVREFSDLADAATDHLLLSLGKGRWAPPRNGNSKLGKVQSDH